MEGSRYSRGEVVSGAVLAALGVYIFVQAWHWEYLTADGPGPGFFPRWYGIAMVVLALVLVGSNLLRRATAPHAAPVNWHRIGHALFTWTAFAVCIALLKPLGFLAGFALFTFFVVVGIYRRPLHVALATAVGCSLGFYLLFPLALNVSLPVGIFGF
jgi:putative tricarboxylic transport membrane protein